MQGVQAARGVVWVGEQVRVRQRARAPEECGLRRGAGGGGREGQGGDGKLSGTCWAVASPSLNSLNWRLRVSVASWAAAWA